MADWASFYVIVGSSGAALIGMQFIVMTLIVDRRQRPTAEALKAFGTPTVMHLTAALVISALMSAPSRSRILVPAALVLCGIGGIAYSAVVFRRAYRQTYYKPVWQDWLWYAGLPCAGYIALTFGAAGLRTGGPLALNVMAIAGLGLLVIGIHNAWDTVTQIVVPHEQRT